MFFKLTVFALVALAISADQGPTVNPPKPQTNPFLSVSPVHPPHSSVGYTVAQINAILANKAKELAAEKEIYIKYKEDAANLCRGGTYVPAAAMVKGKPYTEFIITTVEGMMKLYTNLPDSTALL